MPAKKRSKPHRQNKKTIHRSFESLEAKVLMAGDFNNALIDDVAMNRLIDGLDNVAVWTDSAQQLDELSQPLGMVLDSNGDQITFASQLDLSNSFDSLIVQPVRDQLQGSAVVERDTDSLVSLLSSLPHVTSVCGGMSARNEMTFDITFSHETSLNELGLDLGSEGDALGLSTDAINADLTIETTYDFTFGLRLDPNLSDEQAFFLRDSRIQLGADLHTTNLQNSVSVGVIESAGVFNHIDFDLDLEVELIDVIPDGSPNIELQALNGYNVADITRVSTIADATSLELVVLPQVGDWTAPGTPTVTLNDVALDATEPTIVTNADFDEVANFSNITFDDLHAGTTELQGWLSQFANSSAFSLEIPFLDEAHVSDTFDGGAMLQSIADQMIDVNGELTFLSLAEFENLIGSSFEYDPQSDLLTMQLSLVMPHQTADANVGFDGEVGSIANVEASGNATIEADASANLEWSIDLSSAGDVADQFGVAAMQLDAQLSYTGNANGTLEYGMVGVDFANGSIGGSLDFSAEIANPYLGTGVRATMQELADGLAYPPSLLTTPIEPNVSSDFDLGDLSITDGLFSAAGVNLSLLQTEFTALPELDATGNSLLESLSRLDMSFISDQLVDASGKLLSGIDLSGTWNEVVGTLPLDGDWSQLFIDPQAFAALSGEANLRLQDLPTAVEDFLSQLGLSANVDLVIDELSETVSLSMSFTPVASSIDLEIGLGFDEALGTAIGDPLFVNDGSEFAGDGGPIVAEASASLDIDVEFDVSTAAPAAYLLDSSAAQATLYVNGQTSLAGSLGALAAQFDGSIVIAGDAMHPAKTTPRRSHWTLWTYQLDGTHWTAI